MALPDATETIRQGAGRPGQGRLPAARLRSALLGLGLGLLCAPGSAHAACVLPQRLAEAEAAERASLELIDARCQAGLALLAEGHGAEALPYLKGALARPELLARDLTLPLAEAFFSAGAPTEVSLLAFEAALLMPRQDAAETALVEARLAELIYGLDDGGAEALLARAPGRPSAALLARRVAADARPGPAPAPTAGAVGALLPLSGKLEAAGRRVLDGALVCLRADERLLVVDTAAEAGPLAAQSLYTAGAGALLGPLDRGSVAGALEAAVARGLPMVRLDVGEATDDAPPGVYRMGPSRAAELSAAVREARRRGLTRFAVLAPDSPFGLGVVAAARAAVMAQGLALVDSVSYPAGQADLTQEAERLARKRPDVVFLGDTVSRAGTMARYLAAAGLVTAGLNGRPGVQGEARRVQLVGPSEWRTSALDGPDRRYLLGLWVAAEWDAARTPAVRALAAALAASTGRDATVLEAAGCDGLTLARRLAQGESAEIPEGGLLGTRAFDKHGEPIRDARLYRLSASGDLFERLATAPP